MSGNSYVESLKQDFGALIDGLRVPDGEKHYLRSRWLDQVLWLEGKADQARKRYYRLRVATVLGAVIVPALVGLDVAGDAEEVIRWLTFGVSLVVASCAAIEGFFRFGERWRHYRRTVELLKSEGWRFFQLGENQEGAFPAFATRVEEILQQDVDVYVTRTVRERDVENE
jgi:hypothetical protein